MSLDRVQVVRNHGDFQIFTKTVGSLTPLADILSSGEKALLGSRICRVEIHLAAGQSVTWGRFEGESITVTAGTSPYIVKIKCFNWKYITLQGNALKIVVWQD